jgi:DNA (cytosine-5)-methyltransferase 1
MLTLKDYCSGVGVGFPLAATQLRKFTLTGLCEIDEYCRDILSLRFPGVPIERDIKALDSKREKVEVITASPPCQPFSVQGKRLGADDDRDCFPALLAKIATVKPRFFCIENVRGLLSCPYKPGFKVRYFAGILDQLSRCGYDVEWQVARSGFYQCPFLRERLLLVGFSRSIEFRQQPCTWTEQIRSELEANWTSTKRGVHQPSFSRECFYDSRGMVRPLGVPNGNSTTRRRREALGNCLDPRVAAVALRRVLYLDSISD